MTPREDARVRHTVDRAAFRRTLGLLAAMPLSAALASASQPAASAEPSLEPFTQTITGVTATLDMVPLPEQGVWIASTETTWDLFDVFVYGLDREDPSRPPGVDAITRPSKPYLPPDRGFGHAGYPAIGMTHQSAAAFCEWLSMKTGRSYRLPTEAEWEAACAAGDAEAAALDDIAWHAGNAGAKTHPVGSKRPNAAGIHDLLGNVAEWCIDADGKPVTRGGSYRDAPEIIACSLRVPPSSAWNASDPQIPKSRWWLADGPFVGFRVVCVPEAVEQGTEPAAGPEEK